MSDRPDYSMIYDDAEVILEGVVLPAKQLSEEIVGALRAVGDLGYVTLIVYSDEDKGFSFRALRINDE